MAKYFIQMETYNKETLLLINDDIRFVDEISYNSFSTTDNINQCITFDSCVLADSVCDYLNKTFNQKESTEYGYGFKVVTIKNI